MKCEVLSLRPTQFVVGMREIEDKLKKIRSFSGKEKEKWIAEHPVPGVRGPGGHCYMIDHHHFVAACYHARIDRITLEPIADLSKLKPAAFWAEMKAKEWVYLYDQFGNGPHDPCLLPFDVRCLADDLYRSLAWELRDAGVIAKVQQPFSEFRWAKLLRSEVKIDLHTETYEQAVARALDFAKAKVADSAKRK